MRALHLAPLVALAVAFASGPALAAGKGFGGQKAQAGFGGGSAPRPAASSGFNHKGGHNGHPHHVHSSVGVGFAFGYPWWYPPPYYYYPVVYPAQPVTYVEQNGAAV